MKIPNKLKISFPRYEEMGFNLTSDTNKKGGDKCFITVNNPTDWPKEQGHIESYHEPIVKG